MKAFRLAVLSAVTVCSAAWADDFDDHSQGRMRGPGHRVYLSSEVDIPYASMNAEVNPHRSFHSSHPSPHEHHARTASLGSDTARDCGTGEDAGCTLRRNGTLPMDAESFRGLLHALTRQSNELQRFDLVKSNLQARYVTAKQLAMVLDLFDSEVHRFDAAKLAAKRVVNPKHAVELSTKFESNRHATDYTQMMASQQ